MAADTSTASGAALKIEITISPAIILDCFSGPLGQVLVSLINNAVLHAFQSLR